MSMRRNPRLLADPDDDDGDGATTYCRFFGDRLSENEKQLFDLVAGGNVDELRRFLETQPLYNPERRNAELRTALQVAICRRDPETVRLLLDEGGFKVTDNAVELAAELGFGNVLRILIQPLDDVPTPYADNDHGSPSLDMGRSDFYTPPKTTIDLCQNQNPMILAACAEDLYGVLLLIQKGCRIHEPHKPGCRCHEICKEQNIDQLNLAHDQIKKYKALVSATYIILASEDPIYTAIIRSIMLLDLSTKHPENKNEFDQLSKKSRLVAVDLLDNCVKEEEVYGLLMLQSSLWERGTFKYTRLRLAVDFDQKEFVTHPACQHALLSLWFGSQERWWSQSSLLRRMWYVAVQMVCGPVFCLIYILVCIFTPASERGVFGTRTRSTSCNNVSSNAGFSSAAPAPSRVLQYCRNPIQLVRKYMEVPLNRFLYASESYVVFLALLFYCIGQHGRCHNVAWYHWLLLLFIASHIYKVGQDMYRERLISIRLRLWMLYELLMVTFFGVACSCFVVAKVLNNEETAWGFMLVSDGLFAMATTLACMRTLQWFHMNPSLGPVIISFGRMILIIGHLLVVFVIVLFSFSAGLYAVYKNFHHVNEDELDEDVAEEKGVFLSYRRTLRALFWAIFGHGEADYASVLTGYGWRDDDTGNNSTGSSAMDPNESFPVAIGYTLWGLFHVAFVIVMLNMLIAVMTNCFQAIQDNVDEEWKFSRTKLWMYYFEDPNAVPPPFNLLLGLAYLIRFVVERVAASHFTTTVVNIKDDDTGDYAVTNLQTFPAQPNTRDINASNAATTITIDSDDEEDREDEDRYKVIIQSLVERYLLKRYTRMARQGQDGDSKN